jgi:hypothetical protein
MLDPGGSLLPKTAIVLALACAACSTGSGRIDGRYVGPGGATLKLAGDTYQFCNKACTSGRMEVRPAGKRSGRVTFYGGPVSAFFRNAQQGPAKDLRTWGDGVETGYEFGPFGGAYIDIDPGRHIYFKRRSSAPDANARTGNNAG